MKIKKWKERKNKKKGIILFTILSVFLIVGVFFYQSFAIFKANTNQDLIEGNVIDTKDIYFAFYYDGKIQKEMPGANYILDEENSYCGELGKKEGSFKPIYEEQKVIIDGLTKSHTKCILAFRNYNKVTIGEEVKNVSIPNSTLTISKPNDSLLIQCNNGVTIKENNSQITISNITKDTTCNYYNDSVSAINNIDNSENYILYLKNEDGTVNNTIVKDKKLTIDYNGHSKNGTITNYGQLNLISSNGKAEVDLYINSKEESTTNIKSLNITHQRGVLVISKKTSVKIEDSNIISSESAEMISCIYFDTGNEKNLEIINSNLEGAFGIGGDGANIIIDNSTITGTRYEGIAVNQTGVASNIKILNSSQIKGNSSGIVIYPTDSCVTIDGINEHKPNITGTNDSINIHDGIFIFYEGDLYGKINARTTHTRNGKSIKTINEDGTLHSYLE